MRLLWVRFNQNLANVTDCDLHDEGIKSETEVKFLLSDLEPIDIGSLFEDEPA